MQKIIVIFKFVTSYLERSHALESRQGKSRCRRDDLRRLNSKKDNLRWFWWWQQRKINIKQCRRGFFVEKRVHKRESERKKKQRRRAVSLPSSQRFEI
jgi:hypothetical protein